MNHSKKCDHRIKKKIFKVATQRNEMFKFWGWVVKQSKDGIIKDQNLCISSISPTEIKKGISLRKNHLRQDQKSVLRLTGQIMWASTQTHPDISFDLCQMSNTGKHAKMKILKAKSNYQCWNSIKVLYLSKVGKTFRTEYLCYSDTIYASQESGSSQGSFIVFIWSKMNGMTPTCWSSKILDQGSLSIRDSCTY